MRLLLLRHAATAWTATGQHTGRTDLELTEAGVAEARATAALFTKVLGEETLDAVYSSPRKRALRTAELVLGSAPQPVATEALAEFDYGEYEGLTPAQIQARAPGWSLWEDSCPGGETLDQVTSRVDHFVELFRTPGAAKTVCIVSHGHLLRVLTARLLGLAPTQGRIFAIKTCAIAELNWKDDRFLLGAWNRTLAP